MLPCASLRRERPLLPLSPDLLGGKENTVKNPKIELPEDYGVDSPESFGNSKYAEIVEGETIRRTKKKHVAVLPDDFANDADANDGERTVKFYDGYRKGK